MLGWHVTVYRQLDRNASPASTDSPDRSRVAVWQTGVFGLRWLDEFVKAGTAIDLGGSGYPQRYEALAAHVIPRIVDLPPNACSTVVIEADDVRGKCWGGMTVVDRVAAAACHPDEWLIIEAWDQS
jgi:hypothetical protein